ncbi:MAG: phosphatidate cytidylyltransferase [Candidatus Melainabacteria bacterium]|nr:phosphatidate cytidylyltransferase [Candidatus Melainabacteria bacterium]
MTDTPDSGPSSAASSTSSHWRSRVLVGLCIGGATVLAIFWGGWFWTLFCLSMVLLCTQELFGILAVKGLNPSRRLVITTSVVLLVMAQFQQRQYLLPTLTIGTILSFVRLLFRWPQATIGDLAASLLATFYVGFLCAHFVLLRELGADASPNPFEQVGLGYVLMTCLVVSASDIGSYYTGKRLGKTPLFPNLSPKKTWEGALGGACFAVLTGLICTALLPLPCFHGLVLSVLLVASAQLGDLVESLIKRDAGVKNSGVLLSGHGGFLDRLDSYLFSGAVAYYYLLWFVHQEGIYRDIRSIIGS